MTPEDIREARRLLHDLIFFGKALTVGGRLLDPKDEVLVGILEKIASKKIEEPDVPQTVEGYAPKETFRALTKDSPSPGA